MNDVHREVAEIIGRNYAQAIPPDGRNAVQHLAGDLSELFASFDPEAFRRAWHAAANVEANTWGEGVPQ